MPIYLKVYSTPIILDKTCKNGYFLMDPYELSFLWTIMKNKPMSLYDLKKQKFDFPKNRSVLAIPKGNIDAYISEIGKEKTYFYPFISRVVKRLENKGLVTTRKDSSGPRNRRIVFPTFKGMIYYLQNESPYEEQSSKSIKKSFNIHKEVMSSYLESLGPIGNFINPQGFIDAFLKTLWEFHALRKVRVSIKHLKMTFDGYLEDSRKLSALRLKYMDKDFQEDQKIRECLERDEAYEAKNAYIAYLAMSDIEILSVAGNNNLGFYAPILISENELAKFERREVGSDFLFDGERPKKFFPKYSTIQWFFIGMLAKNLLWVHGKELADAEKTKVRDYRLEEID